ncbi:MAG: hypothetical protein VXU42_04830, partial [Verrucomicrobiota bacterium]|nr:hypothetical protein [Verrucomicrobiota bacterium]
VGGSWLCLGLIVMCSVSCVSTFLGGAAPPPWRATKPFTHTHKKAAFTLCRQGKHLGKSIRTKSHRYTEWIDYVDRDDDHATVRFTELYHLEVDELEQVNLANRIEYAPKRRELAELLNEGWESALPPAN